MDDGRSRVFDDVATPEAYERFLVPSLFEPWARTLVVRASLAPGASVLDVACGPGTVARHAATVVGPSGRVVASDVSAPMLAILAAKPPVPGAAPITCVECSASALEVPTGSVDAVLCQQGLQFFPDRDLAVREMARVLRGDGTAVVSTWAAEAPLGLFGPMLETIAGTGATQPFPGALDPTSFQITAADLTGLLDRGGFGEVTIETIELDATWPNVDAVASGMLGTPYGPIVTALPPEGQTAVRADLARRLGASDVGPVTVRTVSHVARGRRLAAA